MLWAILNKSWKQHPTKQQLYGHLPLISKSIQDEQDKRETVREASTNSQMTFFYKPRHMDVPVLAVWTQDVIWKTSQERWMIGTDEEKELGKSALSVRLDDDDDNNI